jgi:hypothetical protein
VGRLYLCPAAGALGIGGIGHELGEKFGATPGGIGTIGGIGRYDPPMPPVPPMPFAHAADFFGLVLSYAPYAFDPRIDVLGWVGVVTAIGRGEMPRTIDMVAKKSKFENDVNAAVDRFESADPGKRYLKRWIAQMTAVEIHSIWERYAEIRLVAALNHHPDHFLREHQIAGVKRISSGLASYIIRGGNRYFDFRSSDDLLGRSKRWFSDADNPFRNLTAVDRSYIDALSAIRNFIVHRSDAASEMYRQRLKKVYGVKSAPEPDEFLNSKDPRSASPARNKPRVLGLAVKVIDAIRRT